MQMSDGWRAQTLNVNSHARAARQLEETLTGEIPEMAEMSWYHGIKDI